MHGAAYKNFPRVVQLLADKGARIEVWNRKNKYGWTPLSIAEGHRPGNFKPSPETIAALHRVMLAAGVSPTPGATPTDRGPLPAGHGREALAAVPRCFASYLEDRDHEPRRRHGRSCRRGRGRRRRG